MAGRLGSRIVLIYVLLALASACRSKVAIARAEMDGVYKCSKRIQSSLAAGISYKETVDLKIRLDSELAIIADQMRSDASIRNILEPYYQEYSKALQTCALAARAIDVKLRESACEGEPRSFSPNYKLKSSQERLQEYLEVQEYLERGLRCYPEYSKQWSALQDEFSHLNTGCQSARETNCLVSRTDSLLRQADALLYGGR